MREIGGYIEFEKYNRPLLHDKALALNSGRNCLAYLIELKKITKIVLPYFLCDSVKNICIAKRIKIRFYHIDKDFLPLKNLKIENDEWIYLVNFYGQITREKIKELSEKYKRIILDQAQAYFEPAIKEIDTIYTCRKFLGVPDGAFLYTNKRIEKEFPIDKSYKKMEFLLGRFENTASEFYEEYVNNNKKFEKEPVKLMSKLTRNLLCGIDYQEIKEKRTRNYNFLFKSLKEMNRLKLRKVEGAFAYPLLVENGPKIRKKLLENKIYIPILWPNVLVDMQEEELEYKLANNILPVPCDQRYDTTDMEYLKEKIIEAINTK